MLTDLTPKPADGPLATRAEIEYQRWLLARRALELMCREFDVPMLAIRSEGRVTAATREARDACVWLLSTHGGMLDRELALLFGRTKTSIRRSLAAHERRARQDRVRRAA